MLGAGYAQKLTLGCRIDVLSMGVLLLFYEALLTKQKERRSCGGSKKTSINWNCGIKSQRRDQVIVT